MVKEQTTNGGTSDLDTGSANQQLYTAVTGWGNSPDFKAALAAGADPNWKPRCEQLYPIVRAVMAERPDLVKRLIRAGAKINANKGLALRLAVKWPRSVRMVKILLQGGADLHVNDDKPLTYAAMRSSLPKVRLLLAHGADPNCREGSVFRTMVRFDRRRIVGEMLKAGAQIHSASGDALLLAADNLQMLRILLKGNANPRFSFATPNPDDLLDCADNIRQKLTLCKSLMSLCDAERAWSAARQSWLNDFSTALNSWLPADGGPDAETYNETLVRIHRDFDRLASPHMTHVPSPAATALLL